MTGYGFAAALGYATLRYNVFKGVPWQDWAAYTVNKALAVAAVFLVAAAVFRMRRATGRNHVLMAAAGVFALSHSMLSFALLDPAYFPRLYAGEKLTAAAALSMTLGVVTMAVMEAGARLGVGWPKNLQIRVLAVVAFTAGCHAASPALPTWFAPQDWPGGLPPLTLISFTAGVGILPIGLRRGWKVPA